MRTRKSLQILILASALAIGISQPVFNGLSLLALLTLPTVFFSSPARCSASAVRYFASSNYPPKKGRHFGAAPFACPYRFQESPRKLAL
ncbi:hypothetical protein [Arthrobacter globiformis]|uniref:hypothetical protein n=1 Tax=Arthrobacter globiformis TaxID=1665 RepID=UPI0027D812C0|nr:hypothetical protein [Arthrobacter globiformis]